MCGVNVDLKPDLILTGRKITEVSPEFAKIMGYDTLELVGEDIMAFVPESFKPIAENSLKSGGRIILVSQYGKLHKLEVVLKDNQALIVDLKRLKEEIRRAYAPVWEFHYGFVFLGEDGEILTCSKTFYDYTGLKAEDIEGKKLWEVFGDWTRDLFNEILSGKDSIDVEAKIGERTLRGRLKIRTFDICGKKIIEILTRTTEEERLRNLEKTFGNLSYPVIAFENGKIYYQNTRAIELFGNKIGEEWHILQPAEDVSHIKIETKEGLKDYIVFKMPAEEDILLFFDFSDYMELVETLEDELLSYREMVEKSIDAILIIDNKARIRFANQAVRVYGYTPEELIGSRFTKYLLPQDANSILNEYEEFIKTGKFKRKEVPVYTKSGEIRWVDVVSRAIRSKDGTVTRAVVILRDVTERKKMMEELWRSRELYKSFFELSPDFVGVVDVQGRIIYANRQFLNVAGIELKELIGKSPLIFAHEDDRKKALEMFRQALKTGKTVRDIVRTVIAGKVRTLDVAVRFIYSDEGEPLHALVVSRDISDRIELERKLREREELYRSLTENSLAAIFVIQDDRIVYCNRVFEELTGYSREEWEKQSAFACFEDGIAELAKKSVEKVLNGEIVRTIARYITKNGEVRYAEFIMCPIEYRGRRAVLGNAVDITERRMAEMKLIEREELYRTLTESSHTGIFIINKDEKIVYANPRLFEIFGFSSEEIKKFKHPYDVILPEFREMTLSRLRARLRGEDVPESYEIKVRTKKGEKWLKVLASRITYKKEPAVMVNIADITDLKTTEEKLRRLNLLLSVVNEINRIVSHVRTDIRLIRDVRKTLEKLGVKSAVYILKKGRLEAPEASDGMDVSRVENVVRDCIKAGFTLQREDGDWVIASPLAVDTRIYGAIVLVSDEPFDSEALEIIETLARDVAFALKSIEMEREREAAVRVVLTNLDQFEELADKLRNPLAIIKGYIEVREELDTEELISKISEQADRIEKILDELRVREFITYEMKKMLESTRFRRGY